MYGGNPYLNPNVAAGPGYGGPVGGGFFTPTNFDSSTEKGEFDDEPPLLEGKFHPYPNFKFTLVLIIVC